MADGRLVPGRAEISLSQSKGPVSMSAIPLALSGAVLLVSPMIAAPAPPADASAGQRTLASSPVVGLGRRAGSDLGPSVGTWGSRQTPIGKTPVTPALA